MPLMIILILFGLCLWPPVTGTDLAQAPRPAAPAPQPAGAFSWPYYPTPAKLNLCGEAVPLHETMVREDFDREFTIIAWSRAQTTLWIKRARRYFPLIESELHKRGLPQDLKYVVLVESDLLLQARSQAGAQGPWQFMGPTAQRFQLSVGDAVDERLDFSSATDAALRYLKQLYQTFGSWSLALAAYNCGEARVSREMSEQGVRDYYHLGLPQETERYVYRILAAKAVLENPGAYGYDIPGDQLHLPLNFDVVHFKVSKDVAVTRLAAACGSFYKVIKRLNPWIKGRALPPGTYNLKVPQGAAPKFQQAYQRGELGS